MERSLHVLIVEDLEDDAQLLVRELKGGGYTTEFERVDSSGALNSALDLREWDIVIADFTMPQFSGTKALSIIRERGLDVPFIFLSGTIGEDVAVAAMRAGAQDYIMKGNLKRLLPAVERELRDAEIRRARARAEAERVASEARYRNILDMAADAVISVDENQRITVFNHGAVEIFGYTAEEAIGQPIDLLIPERFRPMHGERLRALAMGPDSARRMNEGGDVFGRRKDGKEFPAEATISKLTENDQMALTVILRDVTHRKRAETELRLLQTITQAVGDTADLDSALAITLGEVCEATGWVLAQAWVPRADGNAIECSSAWHYRESGLEPFRAKSLSFTFAPGEDMPGRAWSTQKPVWISDVTRDENFPRAPFAREAGLRAALSVPVLAGDSVVAVLEFFLREPRAEDEAQVKLVSAVATQLGTVIQRKQTEERLHYLAHHDVLTELPNRLLFMDRLRQAIFEADRHERLVGVVFLDLDRFKTINDSLGHGVGDLMLCDVAGRLSSCLRAGDTVARLSGDEFTFILTNMMHVEHAARVAEKIFDCFNEPFCIEGNELYTSASMGISLYPLDGGQAEDMLGHADIAMYRAKEQGGNTYQFYASDMTSKAHARLSLENAMRRGIDRNEFVLKYQPVVSLIDGRVTGAEALIRWNHPEHGVVMPADFIPLAEQTGLIVRLGEWALFTSCREHQANCAAYARSLRLSVNISPRQFRESNFPAVVLRVLQQTGLDPTLLDLEITETLLMQNTDATLAAMHRLSELGINFSVDDFGTGYSSLSYLKRLPIRRVKIDSSFVHDIPRDANGMAIVTAIISMAHDLGMEVIAEGVETEAQVEFLRERGCDSMQGNIFSPPVLRDEVVHWFVNADSPPNDASINISVRSR
jgi:diguanylate cyclase (GGDEF)-like protein/PAS domain S-box-containing protein